MNIKSSFILCSSLLALLFFSNTAYSHDRFILPTHTVLSGKEAQSISLIASISNDVFHPDMPLGDDGKGTSNGHLKKLFAQLQSSATTPDGTKENINWRAYIRQSVSDYTLKKDGTYRLSIVQPPTPMTTFKNADGTPNRKFGKNPELPEGAKDIKNRLISSRVETFISKNEPDRKALAPVGSGLELGGETHPNDLFINEPVSLQLFMNGKAPATNTKVQLIRAGTRHRNQRDEIIVNTDDTGRFDVIFKEAGFYLLKADIEIKGDTNSAIDFYHHSLYVTLEVFPE